jgi:hypothetical protein
MYFREIECDSVNRFQLAQDKDQWLAVVNTVMNRQIPLQAGNS